jgi:hypothetical protein
MSDVFATLVRRSRAADVLAPVVGSVFERPLAEPIWGAGEETRVAPRASSTPDVPAGGERRTATPPTQVPGHDTRVVTRQVVEVRHEDAQPPAFKAPEAREESAAAGPSLDLAAIVEAALRERPRVITKETVVVREAAVPAADGTSGREPARMSVDRGPLVVVTAPPVLPAPVVASHTRPAAPPSIEVRIGRIEVKAAPLPAPSPPPAPRASRPRGVTLQDYLARRGPR